MILCLRFWRVQGEKTTFDRVIPKKDEETCTIYTCDWSSVAMVTSKKGHRTPLIMEFDVSKIIHIISAYSRCARADAVDC